MNRFYVHSFGCRASQSDGAAISHALEQRGLEEAASSRDAELIVLNTCTVTATADDELRQVVRRHHRENPQARILVTGCYAQRAPEEIVGLPGVCWVVGNSHKTQIAEIAGTGRDGAAEFHGEIHAGDIFEQAEFLTAPVEDALGQRTRPNLKIQDGCDNRCSFCVIPSVRGRSRSAPVAQVVDQVRILGQRYREVVLSGINLGRWGRDRGNPQPLRLAGLLRRVIAETEVARIRLASVEPMDVSDELLELMASSPRMAKHLHAPLQSGCDSVLRRMRRRYRSRHYASRIEEAKRLMPDAAIGADVMVGFPGETEAEFGESVKFIEQMPFTYLHVFTYSERPGTPAAVAPDPVPMAVRKERNRRLRALADAKNLTFRQQFVGRQLSAVTLGDGQPALTSNYLRVDLAAPRSANQIVEVTVGSVSPAGLRERPLFPILRG